MSKLRTLFLLPVLCITCFPSIRSLLDWRSCVGIDQLVLLKKMPMLLKNQKVTRWVAFAQRRGESMQMGAWSAEDISYNTVLPTLMYTIYNIFAHITIYTAVHTLHIFKIHVRICIYIWCCSWWRWFSHLRAAMISRFPGSHYVCCRCDCGGSPATKIVHRIHLGAKTTTNRKNSGWEGHSDNAKYTHSQQASVSLGS